MIEVLEALVRQAGQQGVVNNNEIPNEQNENVMNEMLQGVLGGLTNQAQSQGGLGSLLGLLSGKNANPADNNSIMSNPVVQMIAQNVLGNVTSKFGVSNGAAQGMLGNMLPQILGGLISKTNNPNDNDINLDGIMGVLSQGKTQGMNFGNLAGMAGDVFADGKLDMSDLLRVATGAKNNNQQGGGLDVGSLLGGLLGGK